jgi:hypothetical protein
MFTAVMTKLGINPSAPVNMFAARSSKNSRSVMNISVIKGPLRLFIISFSEFIFYSKYGICFFIEIPSSLHCAVSINGIGRTAFIFFTILEKCPEKCM